MRLVTVHKSKGLEYAVVFCPFSWKSSDIERNGEDQVFFHERGTDPEGGLSRFIQDLGSPRYELHKRLAMPLFSLGFTMVALAALLSGEFTRRGQARRILAAALFAAPTGYSASGTMKAAPVASFFSSRS